MWDFLLVKQAELIHTLQFSCHGVALLRVLVSYAFLFEKLGEQKRLGSGIKLLPAFQRLVEDTIQAAVLAWGVSTCLDFILLAADKLKEKRGPVQANLWLLDVTALTVYYTHRLCRRTLKEETKVSTNL